MTFRNKSSNIVIFLLASKWLTAAEPRAPVPLTPNYKIEETIASYRGTGTMDYLAFP
ncbi:hypothetical protein F7C95_06490 [Opitutia bacterium ISCC 51]|nr:hypothetical protein F7C95_06490 [Opitutae bacterium ISCC 51]QXD29608.1 hypothetical protein GA003_06455 [Opitutae bacterium ISCC 52]